jgi:hypothetical protein
MCNPACAQDYNQGAMDAEIATIIANATIANSISTALGRLNGVLSIS